MRSDKQLTDECFNAFLKARPEFQKNFGNKDLQLWYSQLASFIQTGVEFAWDYFKENQMLNGDIDKDTTLLDINTDNTYIVIPHGDKLIKYKKMKDQ